MKNKLLFLFIICIAAFSACKKQPTACFTTSATSITEGASVSFDASCSENAYEYEWDFGDGATSSNMVVSHIYSTEGTYTATLVAYSKKQKKNDTKSVSITVSKAPVIPTISVTPATSIAWHGDTLSFTASMSSESALSSLLISPDTDTSQSLTVTSISGSTSSSYIYYYIVPNTVIDGSSVTIGFTVTNSDNKSATASAVITIVQPTPPTITVTPSTAAGWQGDTISYTVSMTSVSPLTSLSIVPDIGASQSQTVTSISGSYSATYVYNYIIPGTVSDGNTINIGFEVTNNENQAASVSSVITIDEVIPPSVTVSQSATEAWLGETVTFTVQMSDDEALQNLVIISQVITPYTEVTQNLSGTSDTYYWDYTLPTAGIYDGNVIQFSFTVTDNDNAETVKTAAVTVTSPCGPITSYPQFTLGSWNNVNGSFFASVDGTVYTISSAASNQSKIDFVYGYGSTNLATIFAPDDNISGMGDISTYGLSGWTTKNATRFKKVTNTYTWSSITDDCDIEAECASGCTNKYINNLAVGDIVAFITVTGKKGFIKVNSITGTDSAGSAAFEVKVQQ